MWFCYAEKKHFIVDNDDICELVNPKLQEVNTQLKGINNLYSLKLLITQERMSEVLDAILI